VVTTAWCPYCGTEVDDPDDPDEAPRYIGTSRRWDAQAKIEIVQLDGYSQPAHDCCILWLQRRPGWGATIPRIETA